MKKSTISQLLDWQFNTDHKRPPPILDGADVCQNIPCEGYPELDRPVLSSDGTFAGWERIGLRWVKPT